MTTAEDQFRDALRSRNIIPPDQLIGDGAIHRCDAEGRNGKGDAAYLLHLDGIPAGGFENHRDGLAWENWRAEIGRPLAPVEAAAHAELVRTMREQREAELARTRAEAQQRAIQIWRDAAVDAGTHPYLVRKGTKPHGVRHHKSALVVPMRDAQGQVNSLQFIDADGDKRYLTGGRKAGCYFSIGKPAGTIVIAEGFATGASIHEATGHAVAVAFDATNLLPVAKALRETYPDLNIVIAADDDWKTGGNPGITKATEAAAAVGGLVAIPVFGNDRPDSATDFNDLAALSGQSALKRCIDGAKAPVAPEPQAPPPNAVAVDLTARIWPEPLPIRAELPPVPRFDANALLPEVLARWVVDESKRMPCPPDFVASAAIVGLGAAIGARCAIKPKARDSWMVTPNVWGGVVGDPASKKSPAITAGIKPLMRLAAKASEAHQAETQEFESDRLVSEARRDALKDEIKSAAKKADGNPEEVARALQAHNASSPVAPRLRRFSTNDSTVEKLGELLRDNPSGLLVQRDELVGLLASWDREGREGDRAFFLEAWNGDSGFDTDRIGRGSISIPNLCLSVFGGIQPDKLTGYLEQAADALGNDGMLQRFQVLLYPDPCQWEWRDMAPDADARDAVARVFEVLADFDPVSWGATAADAVNRFPHFRFDEGAQAIFVEWATELHQVRIPKEQAEGHPLIAQHLAKYEKAFAAIALIVHLAECASTGRRGTVSEGAAIRAAAWCEFLEAHARRCYGLLADQGARAAQALAYRIRSGALSDGFTARDVRRKQWRHLCTDSAVRDALEWLEGEHWLAPIAANIDAAGRPTIRYAINPKSRKKGAAPTAKTDEMGVSAVMAVPIPATFAGNGAIHG